MSSLLSIFGLIAFTTIDIVSSSTIVPTAIINETDTVIFNVVDYQSTYNGSNFKEQTVDCGTTGTCYIYCGGNGSYVCKNMIVNASSTTNLIIYCGEDACKEFELLGPGPSEYLNLTCAEEKACYKAALSLTNTTVVDITCDAEKGCKSGDFTFLDVVNVSIDCIGSTVCNAMSVSLTTSNDSTILSQMVIHCDGYYRSCKELSVNTVNANSSLYLGCDDDEACSDAQIYCPVDRKCTVFCAQNETQPCDGSDIYIYDPDGDYNDSLLSVSCEDGACLMTKHKCSDEEYTSCTTTSVMPLIDYNCTEGVDFCQTDCVSENCVLRYFDGSPAVSLYVNCTGSGCDGSTVNCPVGEGSNCTIECTEATCQDLVVQNEAGGSMDNFTMICTAGSGACRYATLQLDPTSISYINLLCSASISCYTMVVEIDSDILESVYVECHGLVSCAHLELSVIDSDSATGTISTDCYYSASCLETQVYADNAGDFSITCEGDSACEGIGIWCPYGANDSCIIRSEGNDSAVTLANVYVDELYTHGYFNMECDGWNGCSLSNTSLHVVCEGSKGIYNAIMMYNDTEDEYYCDDGGASHCCPNGNCTTFNGSTLISFDTDLLDIDWYLDGIDSNMTQYINVSNTAELVQNSVNCTAKYCVIQCSGLLSCAFMTISNSTHTIMECYDTFSCLGASLMVSDEVVDHKVTILCLGSNSCDQMTINATNTDSFNVFCSDSGSCQEMAITLDFDDDDDNRTDHGVIYCVESGSCDEMHIRTDSYLTQLQMYQQSDGVILDNGAGYLSDYDNIICVMDEWIRFNGLIETEDTVTDSIADFYPDDDSFPCSDVTVLCGNVSCAMTHETTFDSIGSLFDDDEDVCTVINIQDLDSVTCNGLCPSSPTSPPTNAPTVDPTMEPTLNPSQSPTDSTDSPTQIPTSSPSVEPTSDPSESPTVAPTESPTNSPTKNPTSMNDYDSYVESDYMLSGLTWDEMESIASRVTNFTEDCASMIESGFDNDRYLEFQDVSVNVSKMNGYSLSALENDDLKVTGTGDYITLHSFALCDSADCEVISGESAAAFDEDIFKLFMIDQFMAYFGRNVSVSGDARRLGTDSTLNFSVTSVGSTMSLDSEEDDTPAIVYYILMGISGMIASVGIAGIIYEKAGPKFGIKPKVDASRAGALVALALQFWDFASDISLSLELWSHDDLWNKKLILIAAIGSSAFLLVPYFSNLYVAVTVKKLIKNNDAARTWFENNLTVFALAVVFTGGCYPALEFLLYATVDGLGETVVFAFAASLLSVIAAVLTYCIHRNGQDDDMEAVHYHLSMRKFKKTDQVLEGDDSADGGGTTLNVPGCGTPGGLSPAGTLEDAKSFEASVVEGDLTPKETQKVEQYRGHQKALSRELTKFWNIPDDTIEVGSTVITKQGTITHIVHDMTKEDQLILAAELFPYSEPSEVTSLAVIRKVYQLREEELTKIFRDHYHFATDAFRVEFLDRSAKACRMSLGGNNIPTALKMRQSALRAKLIGSQNSQEMQLTAHIEANKSGHSDWSNHSNELTFSKEDNAEIIATNEDGSETRDIHNLTTMVADELDHMEWDRSVNDEKMY